MANLNLRFYREKDNELYSDGAIENEIYERVCRNDPTLETDPDWTVFYHFSRLRQNIVNWYPFSKDCSILEIGAGCGAITGALCQRAGHVSACELTMPRAKILFERHKSAENLEVCVGNFLEMSFDRRFDYVIINGVLEYARGIMGDGCSDPFLAFLKHAKNCLNPQGKILLAIENRLGLKYLSGAPEDHTGRIFDGINGYKNESYVKTFSKQELTELCQSAQLHVCHWFYPYPDYKFPTEIFTDDSVNRIVPSSPDRPFDLVRAELFDKEEVYRSFMHSNIAQQFSNSFLLELSEDSGQNTPVPTYVKISNNRSKQFSLCTLLYEDGGFAEKRALYSQGYDHLEKMERNVCTQGILQTLPVQYREGTLRSQLLHQQSMKEILQKRIASADSDGIWPVLEQLRSSLFSLTEKKLGGNPEFAKVFGPELPGKPLHWLSRVNIDINADNLFWEDGHWNVIDNEWVFDFEVPVEYALWRMLYQLQEEKLFASSISCEDIEVFLGIGPEEVRVFRKWEVSFAWNYVGIEDLSVHQKAAYPIDMDVALAQWKKQGFLVSHLFLFQEGNDPEVLECQVKNENGRWKACFRSDDIKTASAIRWDPLEGYACRITEIQSGELTVQAVNALPDEEAYTFSTFDPQFYLGGDWSGQSEIVISFSCTLLDWTAGYFRLETERDQLKARVEMLETERDQLKVELEMQQNKMRKSLHRLKKAVNSLSLKNKEEN